MKTKKVKDVEFEEVVKEETTEVVETEVTEEVESTETEETVETTEVENAEEVEAQNESEDPEANEAQNESDKIPDPTKCVSGTLVNCTRLNVRKEPNANATVTTTVKKGQAYTIVEEKDGWGRLKSGAGWISLGYTEKLK